MKPGYKTTEFYLAMVKVLVGPVIAVLFMTGILSGDSSEAETKITDLAFALVTVVSLFLSGSTANKYIEERTTAKIREVEGTSMVEVDRIVAAAIREEDDDDLDRFKG